MVKSKLLPVLILIFSILSCRSAQNDNSGKPVNGNSAIGESLKPLLHKVTVLEVIQVEKYTYLRVKEKEDEIWMAVPSIEANVGDTLFYANGMLMTDFESKELKRTFEKILFVDKITKDESATDNAPKIKEIKDNNPGDDTKEIPASGMGSAKDSVQRIVKVEPPKNGITIADILKNAKDYAGKTVLVRGKVTKYTPAVMGKNWVHIQDGTNYNGKFEIVVTTGEELKLDETVTFKGSVSLNKDLGYGYFYEVLLEDAKVIK